MNLYPDIPDDELRNVVFERLPKWISERTKRKDYLQWVHKKVEHRDYLKDIGSYLIAYWFCNDNLFRTFIITKYPEYPKTVTLAEISSKVAKFIEALKFDAIIAGKYL